jgi:hypothetical protein
MQLTPDGLPSPTALKVTVPKLFKNFTNLFEPSLLTCEKLYNEQYKAWEGTTNIWCQINFFF